MESGDPEVWAEEVEFFLDCCERQENTLEDEPRDIVRLLLNLFQNAPPPVQRRFRLSFDEFLLADLFDANALECILFDLSSKVGFMVSSAPEGRKIATTGISGLGIERTYANAKSLPVAFAAALGAAALDAWKSD